MMPSSNFKKALQEQSDFGAFNYTSINEYRLSRVLG